MNCGLSNLDTLRRHLLAESLGTSTQFDGVLQAIGLAVAGLMDRFCNRKFAYAAADECVVSADREHVIVPRFPIVSVTSVGMKCEGDTAWTTQTGEPVLLDETAGLVRFSGTLGSHRELVKVTYTGGYWFETAEPDADGYPTAVPAGATELPGDLRGAFLLQTEEVWAKRDKLGTGVLDKPADSGLKGLDLVPMVREMLRGHVRYQMS